jgi:NAD(P)H-hydrate epimerase
MGEIDRAAADIGLATPVLMENAGRKVADETAKLLRTVVGKKTLVIIGPGNNGGDGLVAARYLSDWGAEVTVYLCKLRPSTDPNLALVVERSIACIEAANDTGFAQLEDLLSSAELVVDAVFGTGKSRATEGIYEQVLTRLNRVKEQRPDMSVIAVDMPSGLDADTGAVDPACPHVDATITLGYPKPGLYNFPGADRAGKVIIVDIGIPPHLAKDIKTELITHDWVKQVLPVRPAGANKGSFGKVFTVAGSVNYIGAAYLACMGAARVGAGLVTLSTAASLHSVLAAKLVETTHVPLPEAEQGIIARTAVDVLQQWLPQYQVLLMGCGLGQHNDVMEFVKSALFDLPQSRSLPLVLDADALNTLAQIPDWWHKLEGNAILTPHPGEMMRLTGISLQDIQVNRLAVAQQAAIDWQKTVVLKGAYTIIASPDGRSKISPVAHAGLATAGTGDVLAGVIAGLIAQGLPLFDAAACGVYLHGRAAVLAGEQIGMAGMLAGDLLPALPGVIKMIKDVEME